MFRRRYASRYVLQASLPRTLQNFRDTRTSHFCHFCILPRRREGSLIHTATTWPILTVHQCDTSQGNRQRSFTDQRDICCCQCLTNKPVLGTQRPITQLSPCTERANIGAFIKHTDGGKAVLGYGYIGARTDTTQHSGQTPDQQV